MKYTSDPERARFWLNLYGKEENIYEVTYRCFDDVLGSGFTSAKTTEEAEKKIIGDGSWIKSAVARQIIPD